MRRLAAVARACEGTRTPTSAKGGLSARGGVGTCRLARELAHTSTQHEISVTSDKRLVRFLAAVAAGLGHLPHDWYSGMIFHGFDEALGRRRDHRRVVLGASSCRSRGPWHDAFGA